jgi:hypothetical protein
MKLNLKLALPLTLAGALAMFIGLALAKFTPEAWGGVLVEIGAAFALLALLALAEGRLMREVVTKARTAAKEETKALSDRLLRLEELDDAQAERRDRRRVSQEAELAEFDQADLSVENVGKLLNAAYEERLVADDAPLRVRTSTNPKCHVLHMLGFSQSDKKVWSIFLDFEPFLFSTQPYVGSNGSHIPVPVRGERVCRDFG